MNAGTTFLLSGVDIHLWIVVSDPGADSENVLICNITTWTATKDQSCILQPGDHPFITHKSCINYGDSRVTTLQKLIDARDGGALTLQDPLDPAILKRIREKSLDSNRMSLDHADILINQGLVHP
jgi:hypothetical protein